MVKSTTVVSALGGYRVLDLTDERGYLCGKILGDLGADVIKIEPSGGDPGRQTPPFYIDNKNQRHSLYWEAFNTSKLSITLDIKQPKGRRQFSDLLLTTDIVVESFTPGYLGFLGLSYDQMKNINPAVILTSISGFGQNGPYSAFKAPDIVLQAMGGYMNLVGDLDRPPMRTSVPQAYLQASNDAAAGTLIALWHREQTGRGQWVDISAQECILWTNFNNYAFWDFKGVNPVRGNVDHTALVVDQEKHPDFYPCKDGFVIFTPSTGRNGNRTRKFINWMQEEGAASDFLLNVPWEASLEELVGKSVAEMAQKEREEWALKLNQRQKQIKSHCGAFILSKTKKELWQQAVAREFMLAPINNLQEVFEDEHFSARKIWQDLQHPVINKNLIYPGAPYKTNTTPYLIRKQAPSIGEHEQEILYQMVNSAEKSMPLVEAGDEAFKGLKILDFTWVTVGPRTMRYFGDHGATIVKVEAPERYDVGRLLLPFKDDIAGPDRSGWFALYNTNKLGMTIDLANPAGKELIKKLISWADVIVESFRPGVMAKYGLDYVSVAKINPSIVYASTSMFGQYGPYSAFGGYGYHAAAMCGFDELTGWPDRIPIGVFWAYTDHIAPQYLVDAITTALIYRKKTGEGQYIDQSQNESAVQFFAPQLLDYQLNGKIARRNGNRDENAAPHGAFRCKGNDRWCVVVVNSEEEWRTFCQVIHQTELLKDKRFTSLAARKKNEDELERIIEKWTLQYNAAEVMQTLQGAGVAAGIIQTSEDLHFDPQLKLRQHYWQVDHPVIGIHPEDAIPFRFSQSPAQLYRREPLLGEHNMQVCSEILGMNDEEVAAAVIAEAFGTL